MDINKQLPSESPKSNHLASLSKARQALAEARSVDDIKSIRDKAEAARNYAKAAKLGLECQNQAATIKLEAERKAGLMLTQMEKNEGQILRGSQMEPREITPTLEEIGVKKGQSHRWQLEASLPEDEFLHYVQAANEAGREVTSSGLLKLAKHRLACASVEPTEQTGLGVVCELSELLDSESRYSCIYADPPWPYGNQATRGATHNHYPTMELDEICALPIQDVAADNAHLHLWTTNAFLFDAPKVMDAWGFEYKSCMLWVKPTIGTGNYWRVSHEFLLFGIRGKLPFSDRSQRSWIEADRLPVHSQKPIVFCEAIERVSPGPYLELFGRKPVSGWTVWGNQVEKLLFS